MSCDACDVAQEDDAVAYFRWGKANILLDGCNEHLTEVMDVLRNHQSGEQQNLSALVEAAQLAYDFTELDTKSFVAKWGHNITGGEKVRRLQASLKEFATSP